MNKKFRKHIESISRRWPIIGCELEHSLAEWYFEQRENRSRSSVVKAIAWKIFGVIGTLFSYLFIIYMFNHKLVAPDFIKGTIITAVMFIASQAQPQRSGPIFYFENESRFLLRDIWLSDITYNQLLAIWIMLSIRPHTRRRFWFDTFILLGVLVLFLLYLAKRQVFTTWTLILAVSIWILLIEMYRGISNANTIAILAMNRFSGVVEKRHNPTKAALREYAMRCLLFILGLSIFLGLLTLLVYLFSNLAENFMPALFVIIAMICLAASGLIFYYTKFIQPGIVMYKFNERCLRGREIFHLIIYAESESPDVK